MDAFEVAVERVLAEAVPLEAEAVALEDALDRVLATDLKARRDSPSVAVSAMDGYAILESDLGSTLPVAAESFAGSPVPAPLTPGRCARVFTGAPVPPNAERVVVQELVARRPEGAVMPAARPRGAHIRAAKSDFAAGDILLARGTLLSPQALVAAAGADHERVMAVRKPQVAILATGDELREPGRDIGNLASIPDSVTYGVAALALRHGGTVCLKRRLPDQPETLQEAAALALSAADVIVITGGASVGERDFARTMFDGRGLEMIFSKVAIKPGKPVWFARVGRALVVGLPGNPTSAMVTARLFLAPLIAGLAGRDPRAVLKWRAVVLDGETPEAGDRDIFLRALRRDGRIQLASDQDSGAQKTLGQAEALIWRPRAGLAADPGGLRSLTF